MTVMVPPKISPGTDGSEAEPGAAGLAVAGLVGTIEAVNMKGRSLAGMPRAVRYLKADNLRRRDRKGGVPPFGVYLMAFSVWLLRT